MRPWRDLLFRSGNSLEQVRQLAPDRHTIDEQSPGGWTNNGRTSQMTREEDIRVLYPIPEDTSRDTRIPRWESELYPLYQRWRYHCLSHPSRCISYDSYGSITILLGSNTPYQLWKRWSPLRIFSAEWVWDRLEDYTKMNETWTYTPERNRSQGIGPCWKHDRYTLDQ